MHELSVAQSLVELIEAQLLAARLEETRVSVVRVAIGAASAVMPEALRSAFGPASERTPAVAGATLVIDAVPVVVWCEACGAERSPVDQRLVCPVCGQRTPTIVRGKELELVSLEFFNDERSDPDAGRAGHADGPAIRLADHDAAPGDAEDSAGAAADPEEQ